MVEAARSNVEIIELRGKAKRSAAEVKTKNETIQSVGVQRETIDAVPWRSLEEVEPGSWKFFSPANFRSLVPARFLGRCDFNCLV